MRIQEVTDIEWLQGAVETLYGLLDDIDTADDMAKSNDRHYRTIVREIQKRKSRVCSTDGFELFVAEKN